MKHEITELRKLMSERGIDAYYVPYSDFHNSEYVHDHFKVSEFLSGFTGESCDIVVTDEGAWLWTDSRFFLQAEQQLAGTGIEIMRMEEEGVPKVEEFLQELARRHAGKHGAGAFVTGFDGRVTPASFGRKLEEVFGGDEWNVVFKTGDDLAGRIWDARPALEPSRIWELPLWSAGEDSAAKLARVRAEMKACGTDRLLLTDLMETAWLFNLRADDIRYTPVFFGFTLISQTGVKLYVMDGALENGLPESLGFAELRDYYDIYEDVHALPSGSTLWLDTRTCSYELCSMIPSGVEVHDAYTPVALMKIIKNPAEAAGSADAHVKDGIAVTKLIKWVKENVGGEQLTEISVADRLEALRREQEGCFDLSFETISGYGPNAAIIHYAPTPETNADVKPSGFLLLDSGGQYINGTTDITRTIALGPLTQEMIDDYTFVLKGHVDIHMMKMGPETDGTAVDETGRRALKEAGLEFKHGLSHGVGHVLSVHEGPNRIGRTASPVEIKAGMIMSNEPGFYKDGEFGIRIENCMLFEDDGAGNLVNRALTCVPYERAAINKDLLTEEETAWIDDYHAWVRDTLVPLVDEETAEYIKEQTAPL